MLKNTRFLIASSLGVFLEFLDFTLYGYTATIIASVFFPKSNSALDYAFIIFAIGSIFRLMGTITFGYIGDVIGVKKVLTISILLMAFASIGIGVLPGYAIIGIWAPCILLILRCMQGFAVSPEYNAISVYLSRQKNIRRYSFISSFSVAIVGFGMLTSGYIMSKLVDGYSLENLPELRWRLVFILSGAILGITVFALRLSMDAGVANNMPNKMPIINILKTQKIQLTITTLTMGFIAMLSYSLNSFIPAYLQKHRNFPLRDALHLTSGYVYIMIVVILLAGFVSDYIKREKIIAYSILVAAILSPIIFYKLAYGSYVEIEYSLLVFSVLLGAMSGGIPAFLATAFYDNQRYSGSSFAYNFGMACFGGITPWFMFKVSAVHWAIPGATIFIFGIGLFYSLRVICAWNSDRKQIP